MGRKLKLDLHTHVWEATGMTDPTLDVVRQVLDQIKAKGLDGIAITDHHNKDYGVAFKALMDKHFPGEAVILHGWEIEKHPEAAYFEEYQILEIFLDNGTVFRSYCHPGYPSRSIYIEDGIRAIEIANAIHMWHIDKAKVEAVAREHGLLLFKVSDAHRVADIGTLYTEIDLDELYARAVPLSAPVPDPSQAATGE